MEAYKEKDSMYILPTRFKVTGLWTNSELASKLQSVEVLIAYGNTSEGSRLFSGQDPKLLISYFSSFKNQRTILLTSRIFLIRSVALIAKLSFIF